MSDILSGIVEKLEKAKPPETAKAPDPPDTKKEPLPLFDYSKEFREYAKNPLGYNKTP